MYLTDKDNIMMIKHINSIKHFGVFDDWKRKGDLPDFKAKNIIYGWNYSGKTTLSRLFSYLDKSALVDEEYQNIEFEVELDDNSKITERNRDSSALSIKVFNSDFVRDKLHFDTDNVIRGISFIVGEGGDIKQQIVANELYIGAQKAKITTVKEQQLADFEKKFTDESRHIKSEFNSLIDFTKTQFKSVMQSLSTPYSQYTNISQKELIDIKNNALAQDAKQTINGEHYDLNYVSLLNSVCDICMDVLTEKTLDPILSNDTELFDWAKSGLSIYKRKDSALAIGKCAFCGGELTAERVAYLNAFYSNEAARLKDKISTCQESIFAEKKNVEELWLAKISPNDFMDSCQTEFKELSAQYEQCSNNYIALLDDLNRQLEQKKENLFLKIDVAIHDTTAKNDLNEWIHKVEEIIKEHNNIVNSFETTRDSARKAYKEYLVASFLQREKYLQIKSETDTERGENVKLQQEIENKEKDNERLLASIKSILEGKNKLEKYIQRFLCRKDISIKVVNDDHFELYRNGKIAKNLSEGEKMAIAFSHFMVDLESLGDALRNTIVFIDDPISSLDANHIAQVSYLINDFFFRKGLDSSKPEKVCDYCAQLFVATHNFEFFSFLNDANNFQRGKDENATQKYLVKRENETRSTFLKLPKSFGKCKSEYVYLFSEIDAFKEANCPEDKYYIMPNIIRRFLEIYTLIQLPGNKDEIDNRLKLLYDDEFDELKILHNFSHCTSVERATKHEEIIQQMPEIVDALYKLLERNRTHLNSLYEGIERKDKVIV